MILRLKKFQSLLIIYYRIAKMATYTFVMTSAKVGSEGDHFGYQSRSQPCFENRNKIYFLHISRLVHLVCAQMVI